MKERMKEKQSKSRERARGEEASGAGSLQINTAGMTTSNNDSGNRRG